MHKGLRPALAMIELIFTIVIMAIVLMSAPQLIRSATKSGYVAIMQESINETAAQVNMVMGYYWDEADVNENFLPPVLHVSAGNADLDANGTTGLRKGVPLLSLRSFIRSDAQELNASIAADLGNDGGDRDDIDDLIGDTNMTLIAASSADYIENDTIKINTNVSYLSDNPTGGTYAPDGNHKIYFSPDFSSAAPAGTTNIKRIIVTLSSTSGMDELEKSITLNAFSCNIGSNQFEERSF